MNTYKQELIVELSRYMNSGSMPKMALQHLDDAYKTFFHDLKLEGMTDAEVKEESTKLSTAYGEIISELTVLLKKYIEPVAPVNNMQNI